MDKLVYDYNYEIPTPWPLFQQLEDKTIGGDFVALFLSQKERPLVLWDKQIRGGEIKRRPEGISRKLQLELTKNSTRSDPMTTYITTPKQPYTTLGLKFRGITFIVKDFIGNMRFLVQVKDKLGINRRFNFTTLKSQVPFATQWETRLQVKLETTADWHEIYIDLQDLVKRIYGQELDEIVRVQVHPNCHLRMVYVSQQELTTDQVLCRMKYILNQNRAHRQLFPKEANNRIYLLINGTRPVYLQVDLGIPAGIPPAFYNALTVNQGPEAARKGSMLRLIFPSTATPTKNVSKSSLVKLSKTQMKVLAARSKSQDVVVVTISKHPLKAVNSAPSHLSNSFTTLATTKSESKKVSSTNSKPNQSVQAYAFQL